MTARFAAVARRWLWRAVLAVTGGLTVDGALPRGGCVVVANHSSHADTAALLAALDARHAPRFAAAADYWFAAGWRAALGRALGAAFPVRRSGGGSTDMATSAALLRDGRAVVVYPEGTRGGGRFHSGAFRLAAEAGVPVVPVGIVGTGELLPKHGRLRRHHVTVRIGAPLAPDADAARAEVTRLARAESKQPDSIDSASISCRLAGVGARTSASRHKMDRESTESGVRARVGRLAMSLLGLALVVAWAVAEAIVWPLVPELVLFPLVLAAPVTGVRLIPAAVLANMTGGLCTLALGGIGAAPNAPLITEPMRVEVRAEVAAEGALAVRHQPLSGIPFKVYAAEAGRAAAPPLPFLGAAVLARGLRIAAVGAGCALLGVGLRRRPDLYPTVVLGGTALFAVGFTMVVLSWT